MNLFHRHRWETVAKVHVPPDPTAEFNGRGSEAYELVRDLTFGFTRITVRCVRCGKLRQQKLEGEV